MKTDREQIQKLLTEGNRLLQWLDSLPDGIIDDRNKFEADYRVWKNAGISLLQHDQTFHSDFVQAESTGLQKFADLAFKTLKEADERFGGGSNEQQVLLLLIGKNRMVDLRSRLRNAQSEEQREGLAFTEYYRNVIEKQIDVLTSAKAIQV
jgi:hypothetical protein